MVHTEDTFSVYILHNKVNNKIYVGCTRRPVKERWASGKGYIHNKTLNDDIVSFGWSNFETEIVASDMDYDTASELELELIQKYDSFNSDKGYNRITTKGKGLCGYTSKPHVGYNKGMKHTEETKAKMSASHKGIKQSREWVEKRMISMRGRKLTGENLDRTIAVCNANSMKARKPVIATNVETGENIWFESCRAAGRELGCTVVSNAIKTGGVRKGFTYKYAD